MPSQLGAGACRPDRAGTVPGSLLHAGPGCGILQNTDSLQQRLLLEAVSKAAERGGIGRRGRL